MYFRFAKFLQRENGLIGYVQVKDKCQAKTVLDLLKEDTDESNYIRPIKWGTEGGKAINSIQLLVDAAPPEAQNYTYGAGTGTAAGRK